MRTLKGKNPSIAATCTYSPDFFYDRVKDQLLRKIGQGDSILEETRIEEFERYCEAREWQIIGEDETDGHFGDVIAELSRSVEETFPHFGEIRRDSLVRICLFDLFKGEGKGELWSWNDSASVRTRASYLSQFRKVALASVYVFFRLINCDTCCYVVCPQGWDTWGFPRGRVRDCALFGDSRIVEWYEARGLLVEYDDTTNPGAWPFMVMSTFRKRVQETREEDNGKALGPVVLKPAEFMAAVFQETLAEDVHRLVSELKKKIADEAKEDPSRQNQRTVVEQQLDDAEQIVRTRSPEQASLQELRKILKDLLAAWQQANNEWAGQQAARLVVRWTRDNDSHPQQGE
jgi:hypothetical protein